VAAMSNDYDALLADLRVLADTVLDRVDGAVQQILAADAGHTGAGHTRTGDDDTRPETAAGANGAAPTGCSWCPVCAVAALIRGENHELLTKLAAQLAALIAVLRELLARYLPAPAGPAGPAGDEGPPPPEPPDRGGGFVPITVTLRT